MTYKETLTAAMDELAKDAKVRFVGYGLLHGRAAGTLKNVPVDQIIETPVAENLMASMAIGLSLRGLKPVVYFERMDFVLNALDAIVNHLDKIRVMSGDEFTPGVIFRVVVGNRGKPLYTGATHTQDFGDAIQGMVSFPVLAFNTSLPIWMRYREALDGVGRGRSMMLIEYKDLL